MHDYDLHDHAHEHDHEHHHEHTSVSSPEELVAMLTYMLAHNRHHAEELHDLAHQTDGQAAELLHAAVQEFNAGNDKLEQALAILKGE